MSDLRDTVEALLKASVVPTLRASGFKGSMPHFRRIQANVVDLVTFQFDQYGGGLVVELAQGRLDGHTTAWGKHIPAAKLTAWDLHPDLRHRIQPHPGSGTDSWFRYDQDSSPDICITKVAAAVPRMEAWFRRAASDA